MNNTLYQRLRAFLARQGIRVFSAPYLPDRLVAAAAILILLDGLLTLASQDLVYWFNPAKASSQVAWVKSLLSFHPLAFIAGFILYAAAASLLLQILTRSLALIAWSMLAFLHLPLIVANLGDLLGLVKAEASAPISIIQPVLAGLLAGSLLSILLLRPARAKVEAATDAAAPDTHPARQRPGIRQLWHSAGWPLRAALILVPLLAAGGLWYFNATRGWHLVRPAHTPGSRCCMAFTYDSTRSRAILFGGSSEWLGNSQDQLDDTWEWTGSDWVEVVVTEKPPARHHASMAYDEARGVIVMFGGMTKETRLNDTWEYDGATWKPIYPSDSAPAPRTGHRLFYDPARQKVVLSGGYGGQDNQGNNLFYSDAYEWDGQTWTKITTTASGHVVTRQGIAWDPDNQRFVAMQYDYPVTWTGKGWTVLHAINIPTGRDDSGMAAIPGKGVLLYGGLQKEGYLDETWLLAGDRWKPVNSLSNPGPRGDFAFFYDPIKQRVYLYGGNNGDNRYLNDMWSFTLP